MEKMWYIGIGVMTMASKYQFSENEIAEIQEAYRTSEDKRARTRLKALELRASGCAAREVARATGFHRAYVTQLVAKYRDYGLEAIAGNHYGGNHRNMSLEEETAILAPYLERMRSGERVSTREIAEAYQKAVDHPVGSSQIYCVLHRHGWSKPAPQEEATST
jgi:transposase